MRLAFRAKIVKPKMHHETYKCFCHIVKEGKSKSHITVHIVYLHSEPYSNGYLQYDYSPVHCKFGPNQYQI